MKKDKEFCGICEYGRINTEEPDSHSIDNVVSGVNELIKKYEGLVEIAECQMSYNDRRIYQNILSDLCELIESH